MAWYVDKTNVKVANGTESVWTADYDPGDTVPQSGIYKCRSCKREVTSNKGDPFWFGRTPRDREPAKLWIH
jgi:peptide methionine sulfoxide reductase MsrB